MPKLTGLSISGSVDNLIYTSPFNKNATISINMCNISNVNAYINLGHCASGSHAMTQTDYIEFNTTITPGNTLERTGLTPANQECIRAMSTQPITVLVYGYEQQSS